MAALIGDGGFTVYLVRFIITLHGRHNFTTKFTWSSKLIYGRTEDLAISAYSENQSPPK